MKIVRKSQMPNGTQIQIEDWRENYSFIKTFEIGTYPKAKNSSKSGYICSNETFRLTLTRFENDEQVEKIFNQLEKGEIMLEELSEYFYNGHKDKFYLGLVDSEEIERDQEENEI